MSWASNIFRSLARGGSADDGAERKEPTSAPAPAPRPKAPDWQTSGFEAKRPMFDAIGQRDEVVRQRIGAMIERLDDLKSLQDDFAEILSPLGRISEDLSRASVRIAELESALSQERQAGLAHRQEASDLVLRLNSVGNDLSATMTRAEQAEADLHDRNSTVEELRIALRDKLLALENLERQLFAEAEQHKALIGENKALRAEAQAADSALTRSEHDLLEARERLTVYEQDNRRLQALSEEQGGQLADLGGRYREMEAAADSDRQRVRTLEAHLAAETSARERSEAQFEAEVSGHRTERAGLAMKLEAADNRATSTEQLLAQARNQLREKDDAYRTSERNLKELSIARGTSERRLDSVQADLARQTERFLEMQRLRTELEARCDMLAKALAAKDAALEQSASRNHALTERVEQLTARHEASRADLESANRRLAEDLQNERAERALMQGALEIARESRVALQKQHEALRRSSRGWRESQQSGNDMDDSEARSSEASNVHPFSTTGKPV